MPVLTFFPPAVAGTVPPATAAGATIADQNLDSPPEGSAYKGVGAPTSASTSTAPLLLALSIVLVLLLLVGLKLRVWLGKLTQGRGVSARTQAKVRVRDMEERENDRGDEEKRDERMWKVAGDEDQERERDRGLPMRMEKLVEYSDGEQYTPIPFTQEPTSYFWADESLQSQHSLLSSSPQQSQSSLDSISSSSESAPATSPLSSDIPRRRSYTKTIDSIDGQMSVEGEILETESWRRHTRVYGGGVCLACLESEQRNEKIRKMLGMEASD